MGVTNYHTINGRIVGETKDGVRRHYVHDAVGSVVATLDSNGTIENTYRYKPFGALLAKTGTAPDPRIGWHGTRSVAGAPRLVDARISAPLNTSTAAFLSSKTNVGGLPSYVVGGAQPTCRVDPLAPGFTGPLDIWIDRIQSTVRPDCARIQFRTRWVIPDGKKYREGGVIQRVVKFGTGYNCKDKKTSIQIDHFLEVWTYKDGWLLGDEDVFEVRPFGNPDCTQGQVLNSGLAGYYEFSHKELSNWAGEGGLDTIPTLRPVPRDWKDGKTFKKLTFTWDCCRDPKGWKYDARCGPKFPFEKSGEEKPGEEKNCVDKCLH